MPILAHPNTHRPILYAIAGIGLAELFADEEHAAVAIPSRCRGNTLPSISRLPYGISLEQALADRALFDRVLKESLR